MENNFSNGDRSMIYLLRGHNSWWATDPMSIDQRPAVETLFSIRPARSDLNPPPRSWAISD
jgi:hypothetical protein